MHKTVTRFVTALLLFFGVVFGNLALSPAVHADEDTNSRRPFTSVTLNPENPTTSDDDLPKVTDNNSSASSLNNSDRRPFTSVQVPDSEEGTNLDESPTDTDENTETETGETGESGESSDSTPETSTCQQESGTLGWIVCPTMDIVTNIVDAIYRAIEQLLVVQPLSMTNDSPIFLVWQYMRNLTNVIFIIFLVVVIYSQLTGLGISNYGVKRVLPRLIIAVILVNLSFIICSVAVDLSNIIGFSLRDTLNKIQDAVITAGSSTLSADIPIATIVGTLLSGGTIAGVVISAMGGLGWLFWLLVPILIGGLISIVIGVITIAARQALVALLIMIAPLAFVAYLLPNTEKWFEKWKDLLFRMLVFYPLFSFLFGASQLAGWALIASASNPLGIILGLAVQIVPLAFSFTLMKMSGTVLGNLSAGLHRLASPMQRAATGWSISHGERAKNNHLAYSSAPGARLRGYLDKRRDLRALDTQNALETRRNRSLAGVYAKASSSTGRDQLGNDTWQSRPNSHTRNAKTANYYSTVAATARTAYENTLSDYGSHFHDAASARLSDQHGEAFTESMKQHYLAQNLAQADQEFLLGRYMGAISSSNKNPYEYNRLIKSAAGALGHTGESSIMGQVIVENSKIETRRRTEARIMANKFGIRKAYMRGMTFDKAYINDNGYETNENGIPIEDDQYRLITTDANGNPTNFKRQEWQHYIAVHKTTGNEITKAEYDALGTDERNAYRKVRYFDITNDSGEMVQRVFEDDAGYMKELLRDDIAIADPINRRYLTSIGVAHSDKESTGILRRYHSTIAAAMLETSYKEHAAEVTPMITSQANSGYITSIGQYNIANLQSLSVASKAGTFFQNDSYVYKDWANLVKCAFDDQLFAKYFPDEDVNNYRNVNGIHLDGFRWDEAKQAWQEINHNDSSITLEDKKNFVRHKIIPKAATKMVGMLYRDLSPTVLDNMKPDNLKALKGLLDTLIETGAENFAETRDPQDRLNGNLNIFDNSDPKELKGRVVSAAAYIENLLAQLNNGDDSSDNDNNSPNNDGGNGGNGGNGNGGNGGSSPDGKTTAEQIYREGLRILAERQARNKQAKNAKAKRTSHSEVRDVVNSYFDIPDISVIAAGNAVEDYLKDNDRFSNDPTFQKALHDLVSKYTDDKPATSTEEVIYQSTHRNEIEAARSSEANIESFRDELNALIDGFYGK